MRPNENLPFSLDEYRQRLDKVRANMDARGIDLALISVPENIYYLTGYTTLGYYMYQVLMLPIDDEPTLLTYREERINVERLSWLERHVDYEVTDDPVAVTVDTVRGLGVSGKTLSVEEGAYFFPIRVYRQLTSAIDDVRWVDGTGLVDSARVVKSDAEMGYIRAAAQATMAGMDEALAVARVGRTENDVAGALYQAMLAEGSEYPGSPPYVISGERSGLPHGTWEGRELRDGDIVFLEFAGCVKRYSAAMMRTAFLGTPPAAVRDRAKAVIDCVEAAIGAIRPGVTSGEVDAAAREAIRSHGFGEHTHETGYSIGVCYPPGWNETHIMNLQPSDGTVLQRNMVFHFVPSLIVEELNGHVGFSETVAVTDDGCEVLTDHRVPRELQVLPVTEEVLA